MNFYLRVINSILSSAVSKLFFYLQLLKFHANLSRMKVNFVLYFRIHLNRGMKNVNSKMWNNVYKNSSWQELVVGGKAHREHCEKNRYLNRLGNFQWRWMVCARAGMCVQVPRACHSTFTPRLQFSKRWLLVSKVNYESIICRSVSFIGLII